MDENDRALVRMLSDKGPKLEVAVLVFASAVIFGAVVRHGYSASVDVAHHYALINWLLEHWSVRPDTSSILGEMTIYPRYSHVFAAMVARLVGSPFLAMQIVTSTALIATWTAISLSPRLVSRSASWPFTAILIVLLALNHYFMGLEVFGHEILGNFFFSQLAAQAVFMALLALAAHIEFRGSFSTMVPVGVIVASIAVSGIHLLPAVEGVGYGLLLLFVRAVSDRQRLVPRAAVLFLIAIVSAFALYKHPAFAAMRGISENNGDLPLTLLNSLPRLVTLAALTTLTSLALLLLSLPHVRVHSGDVAVAARHFGCAGTAIAVLFLAQVVAFKFGYGSEYAYRKYGFGLATFLFLNTALLLSRAWPWIRPRSANNLTVAPYSCLQPLAILLAFWGFTFSGSPASVDTASFLATEAAASTAKQIGAIEGPKPAYARGLSVGSMSDVADYLISVGIFWSARDGNGYASLRNIDFPNPDRIGSIFTTTRVPSVWSDPECIRTRLGNGFAIADGSCIMAKFSNECQASADFSTSGHIPSSMLAGFGQTEPSGRWTVENHATYTCTYKEGARPHKIALTLQPFSPNGRQQTIEVSINGVMVGHTRTNEATTLVLDTPDVEAATNHLLRVDLSLPEAISPRDAGISSDARSLGVMVNRLKLD